MSQTVTDYSDLDRQRLRRLRQLGLELRHFFDVGASNGCWSNSVSEDFPDATFDLFEPLIDHAAAYREIMESNLDEIHELDHLLDVLLNLARMETQDPAEREMTDLSVLATTVLDDFGLVAESRHCRVESQFPPLPQVRMDRSLMRQALINLFDNATKYAADGSKQRVCRKCGLVFGTISPANPKYATAAKSK